MSQWKVIKVPHSAEEMMGNKEFITETKVGQVDAESAIEAVAKAFYLPLVHLEPPVKPEYLGHGLWFINRRNLAFYYAIEAF